jgi:hypothetical protein
MNITTLALALSLSAGASGVALAQARILPATPYLEPTSAGSSANFDVLVTNDRAWPVEVSEIVVVTLDARGAAVLERRIDGNGFAPAIETVANRVLAPGETRLYFNPFPEIPADLAASGVRVKVTLERVLKDGEKPPEGETAATLEARAVFAAAPPWTRKLVLPVAGKVAVWDGHDLLSHHRRFDYAHPFLKSVGIGANAMRYSYDLVPVDAEGRMAVGDEAKNESYLGFGKPVRAPADGVVVAALDTRPDDHGFDPGELKTAPNALFGNYLVIRHTDGLHSVLGHLHQASLKVKVGDTVKAGQSVAAIGASGSSLFPHLHYQLMTGPTMRDEGAPSGFSGLTRVRGAARAPIANGAIDSGDVVEGK